MTDAVLIAAIAAIPPTLASLAALVHSMQNGRKIKEIHEATNGLKDELVSSVRKAAYAEGVKSETDKPPHPSIP